MVLVDLPGVISVSLFFTDLFLQINDFFNNHFRNFVYFLYCFSCNTQMHDALYNPSFICHFVYRPLQQEWPLTQKKPFLALAKLTCRIQMPSFSAFKVSFFQY